MNKRRETGRYNKEMGAQGRNETITISITNSGHSTLTALATVRLYANIMHG